MNFLEAPLVVGIISYFVYMTFELFARKKERILLIEKMGQNLTPIDSSLFKNQFSSLLPSFRKKSFTALRFGCLLVGIGLGLIFGICLAAFFSNELRDNNWRNGDLISIACFAPVILFGGLGLIISYLIESKPSAPKEP
jgi:hypothetical protein